MNWGIAHLIANGSASEQQSEICVRIMKSLFLKTDKEGGDPYEAMLEQSNTLRQDMGHSLAEIAFNRRTRSLITSINNSPKETIVKERRDARKYSVKRSHDWQSRKLSELDIGQSVFFQHVEGQNWRLGKVTQYFSGGRTEWRHLP